MVVAAPSMAVCVGHLTSVSGTSGISRAHFASPQLLSAWRAGRICRTGSTPSSVHSAFAGGASDFTSAVQISGRRRSNPSRSIIVTMQQQQQQRGQVKPVMQFIRGIDERVVPDVKLTRSTDGATGVAIFTFDQPSVFDSSRELGDITGLYMLDEEGTLSTVNVSAKFLNGKPSKIEGQYIMRNTTEWDRFMRFMERYAQENQLGFVKS